MRWHDWLSLHVQALVKKRYPTFNGTISFSCFLLLFAKNADRILGRLLQGTR